MAADHEARRAMRAVHLVFAGAGFAAASWASRIPQLRDLLDVTPSQLGLVLLAVAVGSMVSLPLAGIVVGHLGAARTVLVTSCLAAVGVATVALGSTVGVVPVVIGFFAYGVGGGTWDVAMNVEGAAVEQRLRRTIMTHFHASFSLGTVVGALVGAGLIALDVSVRNHLLGVAIVTALGTPLAARSFLPVAITRAHDDEPRRSAWAAWTEPRTLLLGVFVLAFGFTEGTGNDWLGIAMIDGHGASAALGTLTLALFLAAMTGTRWYAPRLLDRHGRVPVLRVAGGIALVGLVLVVFGGSLPVALVGAVLWGVGAALGFPVGMSAAADDPRHAAARVAVVSSIGYAAFLVGPPLIGLLGDHVGVLRSLTVAAGLLAVGLLVSGALRPPDSGNASTTIADDTPGS
ncbi:MAG: putative MFS-type transporter [Thermoleophilia bacterium]|nr:putative MFS-type transporter [Thermoleophilia bacterium]